MNKVFSLLSKYFKKNKEMMLFKNEDGYGTEMWKWWGDAELRRRRYEKKSAVLAILISLFFIYLFFYFD